MNPYLLIAVAAGWLSSCAGAAFVGWDYRDGKVAQEKLAVATAYAAWTEQLQETADGLDADLAAARTVQAPKDRLITKEITRYVQITPPAQRCTLPGTWRLRHDAAATGTPIDTEAGPVATGGTDPVEDATALETVGENYAAARECIDKLKGWHRRYREIEQ